MTQPLQVAPCVRQLGGKFSRLYMVNMECGSRSPVLRALLAKRICPQIRKPQFSPSRGAVESMIFFAPLVVLLS